jgi:hypothetical protein
LKLLIQFNGSLREIGKLPKTLDNSQPFTMAFSGKRPGVGQPKGSTNVVQFRDFVSE